MSGTLSESSQVLVEELMEESVAKHKEPLDDRHAALEAEMVATMNSVISTDDIVELNVGGEFVTTRRSTLLCAPEASLFNAMFSGRWDSSLPCDSHGRVVLDITPALFSVILSKLRAESLRTSSGARKRMSPEIPKNYAEEFGAMVKYFGLDELFFGAEPSWNLDMLPHPRIQVVDSPAEAGCMPSVALTLTSAGHAPAVGREALPRSECAWRFTVEQLHNNSWVGLGIIGEKKPPDLMSYCRPTSFVWAGHGQVYIGGANKGPHGGWSHWQTGDVAVMKFHAEKGTLKMYHKRLSRVFEIVGIPKEADYRVFVGLHGADDKILLEHSTLEDDAIVS